MSRKIRFSKESQSSLNDFFVHRSPEQPKSKAEENLPAGILSAFRTDVGKVRANNQDAPIVSEKLRLYGVADGMGGHKGGEVASTSARDDLLRELEGKTPSVAALSGGMTVRSGTSFAAPHVAAAARLRRSTAKSTISRSMTTH